MSLFEYAVTPHDQGEFERLVVFCSQEGECKLSDVPVPQRRSLEQLLNGKGAQGWELVQILPGQGGLLAIWKRRLDAAGKSASIQRLKCD
ncbi:hypothetical protein ACFL0Q_00070 [Thermodesulfobacteriota bacterium]